MGLIRFALRNPYAVLAISIGLCLLGLAVVPSMSVDILPDFEKPVVVSFLLLSRSADDGHGEKRHLAGRAGPDARRAVWSTRNRGRSPEPR